MRKTAKPRLKEIVSRRSGEWRENTDCLGTAWLLNVGDPTFAAGKTAEAVSHILGDSPIRRLRAMGEAASLKTEIQGLKARVEALEMMLREPEGAPVGDFEKWANSDGADEYAGKHVAYVPGRGPIDSDVSLSALVDRVSSESGAIFGHIPGE